MLWQRRGLVAAPPRTGLWQTHAQCPTAVVLDDDRWRIFVSGRDAMNRARVFAFDVAPRAGMRVIATHAQPLLDLAEPGALGDAGVGASCVLRTTRGWQMLSVGFRTRAGRRPLQAIASASSRDGLHFVHDGSEPLLAPDTADDAAFVSMPFLDAHADPNTLLFTGGFEHVGIDADYGIWMTRSADARRWNSPRTRLMEQPASVMPRPCVRPWIAAFAGRRYLWYAQRGLHARTAGPDAYRLMSVEIGADVQPICAPAEIAFEQPPQRGDFDAWMQAYPCVMPLDGGLVLFYNGNDFGREGFGWASAAV